MSKFCIKCGKMIDENTDPYSNRKICVECVEKLNQEAAQKQEQTTSLQVNKAEFSGYYILVIVSMVIATIMMKYFCNAIMFKAEERVGFKNLVDAVDDLSNYGKWYMGFVFFLFVSFISSIIGYDTNHRPRSATRTFLIFLTLVLCVLAFNDMFTLATMNNDSLDNGVLLPVLAFLIFLPVFLDALHTIELTIARNSKKVNETMVGFIITSIIILFLVFVFFTETFS